MSNIPKVNDFEWIEDTSKFNEDFLKIYNEESDEGYFLEVNVQYFENLHELHNDLPLLPGSLKKSRKTCYQFTWQKWICYSDKEFNASIKSWISFEKTSESD